MKKIGLKWKWIVKVKIVNHNTLHNLFLFSRKLSCDQVIKLSCFDGFDAMVDFDHFLLNFNRILRELKIKPWDYSVKIIVKGINTD